MRVKRGADASPSRVGPDRHHADACRVVERVLAHGVRAVGEVGAAAEHRAVGIDGDEHRCDLRPRGDVAEGVVVTVGCATVAQRQVRRRGELAQLGVLLGPHDPDLDVAHDSAFTGD